VSKEVKYSRILLKRSNVVGLTATTAATTDHTILPTWRTTDVYVGEFFLNSEDEKMWIRTDHSIKEIPLLDSESSLNAFPDVTISNPTDGQVLTFSGGSWVNRVPDVAGTGLTYTVSPLTMSLPSMLSAPLTMSVELPIEITNPQTEQMLVYSGGTWINKTKLDKIESLSWDKSENKLLIETEQGTFNLSLQGKPIHIITEDVILSESFYTIIVDASLQEINIFLPSAENSYGYIYKIKVINYTYNTTILPANSNLIYTDTILSELIINGNSNEKNITLQCDGIFSSFKKNI